MSTTRRKAVEAAPPPQHEPDWPKLAATTDEEIAAQIAEDPDVAPDVSDWPISRVVDPLDVRAIRERLGMSQTQFATTFGLTLDTLQEWEQKRRSPRGAVRTLLQIIDREPAAVRRAIGTATLAKRKKKAPRAGSMEG